MLFSANAQSNFHEIDVAPVHFPVDVSTGAGLPCNVDIVLVYDRSGSMEYDTLCYGCWELSDDPERQYPSGFIYPLPWSSTTTATADHCASECEETDYVPYSGDKDFQVNDCNYYHEGDDEYHIVIEAEEYSSLSVDYHRAYYEFYKTYWVMQRNAENAHFERYGKWRIRDVGAMGRDGRGAYLSHHPYRDAEYWLGTLGVACTLDALRADEKCRYAWEDGRPDGTILEGPVPGGPFDTPRADYEFYAPRAGDYYFWIRGQAGIQLTKWGRDRNNRIFWGINNEYWDAEEEEGFPLDPGFDGAIENSWDWRCLGAKNLPEGNATLNLWAGGAGFDVDRIVITTDNQGNTCIGDSDPPGNIENFVPNNGRTGWACDPCDPRFAGRPGGQAAPYRPNCPRDTRFDDIYDDEQHIRRALEAAKHFVGMLNPGSHQIGYVSYSNDAVIESELQCLRDPGVDVCTLDVFTDTVITALDSTRAGGGTNIADGIQKGIEVLSTEIPHYGRPDTDRIMILMTDGQANLYSNDECWEWSVPGSAPDEEKTAACVIYYAQQAANEDIHIYTITLGWGADQDLMQQVAEITQGKHFHAPDASTLIGIFDELSPFHYCLPPASEKTTSIETVTYGETITYTITIPVPFPWNEEASTAHLTDVVPPGLSYVPGTLASTIGVVTDTDAPILHWSGNLSPYYLINITYAVTVSATAPQVITNAAVISAPDYQTITRTAIITVQDAFQSVVGLSADAVNVLPDRSHVFTVTITDALGRAVKGIPVSFSTDIGAFDSSGIEPQYVEETTNAAGQATVTIYGNYTGTATIRAWLDLNNDNAWDVDEPYDVANQHWVLPPPPPYILVSSYEVIPLETITIDVMDHPITDSYSLLWCSVSGTTDTSTVVQDPIVVDAGGSATDLEFIIPEESEGWYRLETHPTGSGSGDCSSGDQITCSIEIHVTPAPTAPTVTKQASSTTVQAGERLTYTVVIHSDSELLDTVLFTDTIPSGLSYVSGTLAATTGAVTDANAPTLRWSGDLNPSSTVTITYTITASVAESQVITNAAVVVAPGFPSITRTATVTVQVPSLPDLAPSYKAASTRYADYGERITYTVAISNSTGPLSNIVLFTDTLPDGLSYIPETLTATTGIVNDADVPTLRWSGFLSPTPAITITYAVTASVAESQVITNTASIVAPGCQTITRTVAINVQVASWQNIYLPLVMRNFADSWWPRSHAQEKRLVLK